MDLMVVKHDSRRELFRIEKLRGGIALAIKKRPVTDEQLDRIVDEVEVELRGLKTREVKADLIGALVMKKLKAIDHVAYIRFASVCRGFDDAQNFQDEVKELLLSNSENTGE